MNIKEYIASGVLEIYVLGLATKEESMEVERLAAQYSEVRAELNEIALALELYAGQNQQQPHSNIKPLIMATVDYTERLENGEPPSFPPTLNGSSKKEDYAEWLDRADMILPSDFNEIFVKIIGYTPEVTSAIVWMKNSAPVEVHDDEIEKFLILEGTCDITIGDHVHALVPGDYLAIPLHTSHHVTVTSVIPCKVLLQRIAA